jgi:cyclomaltodextrinase
MHLILDGVFNHVGRDFWAFLDVQVHLKASEYCDWFYGLEFGPESP